MADEMFFGSKHNHFQSAHTSRDNMMFFCVFLGNWTGLGPTNDINIPSGILVVLINTHAGVLLYSIRVSGC